MIVRPDDKEMEELHEANTEKYGYGFPNFPVAMLYYKLLKSTEDINKDFSLSQHELLLNDAVKFGRKK